MGLPANKTRYKRAYDLTVLTAAHLFPPLVLVWLLLWTLIPLAIWMEDRGPVFFRQRRVGKDGREFTFLKFRTMVAGADALGLTTSEHDPRVTRVGGLLRRTALDELPQIINILRGDMSFVGPRALPTEMHEEASIQVPRFPERLGVTPGLTGVAQLYLPRHCHPRRRLGYDLLYIKKAGLLLDVRLMFRAAWNTLTGSWGTGHLRPEAVVENEQGVAREV
jgi:lipopolysaccharide/colanic/teichoic acid biosynthesis glycosyltransferase